MGRWVPTVLALVAVAFAGSPSNGFVNWDDGIWIYENPLVVTPGQQSWIDRMLTPQVGYPAPIPIAVYGWLYALGGEAWPFHAFSLAVHLINVTLLMVALRSTGVGVRVAAAAGLAFGVHPIVVEPVAWATGLKDLLMATGFLSAMLVFRRRPLAAIPFALLAFGSKPASVLLALPLAASAWLQLPRSRVRAWTTVAVVGAAGLGLGLWTMAAETPMLRTRAEAPFSVLRLVGAAGLQLQHLLSPGTLAPCYAPSRMGALQLGLGGVALGGVAWLAVRWIRARDPRLSWLAMGIAAYLPVSNLVTLERFTADSYMYVPWMATVACIASTAPQLAALAARRGARAIGLARAVVITVCVAWGVWTAVQVEVWASSTTLWRECYLAQPDDPETIYNYGDALGRAGKLSDELALYLQHEDELHEAPKVPVVLPVFYERSGDVERAVQWYAHAFGRPTAQDETLYTHYVELVAREPSAHREQLDDVLIYALPRYVQSHGVAELSEEQRAHLAVHAQRLGLPASVRARLGAP